MTFKEKYDQSNNWQEKVSVMEIYHLIGLCRNNFWTISYTATYFEVSIGLVSENLKLADALHYNEKLVKCESRQDALKKLNGSRYEKRFERSIFDDDSR